MRNFRSHPTQRRDHYQEPTDKIIAALEAGVTPWRRPWDPNACGGSNVPISQSRFSSPSSVRHPPPEAVGLPALHSRLISTSVALQSRLSGASLGRLEKQLHGP
ncbi:MAG: DUF1738 domain-containing protein, partial [Hyphomicrobiales bacterium]|nr:DUF1738 domain-containing protein [Hyphomicrobiales bacterium]